ncbi:MAG: RNA 2',3'-cyclic phosphodiesterase [Candidatus Aenigmarchaeota archaeon]|nr:RNA 2',3'-cyclic phosphodiesterase [Candidatus Aenigmarchaeota archaeon]
MARLFIGIMVPDGPKPDIADLQESLRRMPMEMKAVEGRSLHVSLSFLGNVREDSVPEIAADMDRICGGRVGFTAKIGGPVLIPNAEHMRVVALDVTSNGDLLEELRKEIVSAVGGESHPCHLTIARIRKVNDREFVRRSVPLLKIEKYFEVGSVCLVKSVLTGRGPKYKILHESRMA